MKVDKNLAVGKTFIHGSHVLKVVEVPEAKSDFTANCKMCAFHGTFDADKVRQDGFDGVCGWPEDGHRPCCDCDRRQDGKWVAFVVQAKKQKEVKKWRRIRDDAVVLVYKLSCGCKCKSKKAEIHPCDTTEIGTPVCPECGDDMAYSHTEVKQ